MLGNCTCSIQSYSSIEHEWFECLRVTIDVI